MAACPCGFQSFIPQSSDHTEPTGLSPGRMSILILLAIVLCLEPHTPCVAIKLFDLEQNKPPQNFLHLFLSLSRFFFHLIPPWSSREAAGEGKREQAQIPLCSPHLLKRPHMKVGKSSSGVCQATMSPSSPPSPYPIKHWEHNAFPAAVQQCLQQYYFPCLFT